MWQPLFNQEHSLSLSLWSSCHPEGAFEWISLGGNLRRCFAWKGRLPSQEPPLLEEAAGGSFLGPGCSDLACSGGKAQNGKPASGGSNSYFKRSLLQKYPQARESKGHPCWCGKNTLLTALAATIQQAHLSPSQPSTPGDQAISKRYGPPLLVLKVAGLAAQCTPRVTWKPPNPPKASKPNAWEPPRYVARSWSMFPLDFL